MSIATKVHINMLSLLLAQSLLRSSIFKLLFLNLCFDKRESFAARAAAGHILLPVASKVKQKRICGGVPPTCQNRKYQSAQCQFSPTRSPTAAWRDSLYHRQSVNVLPLTTFFHLPSVRNSKRSPIHVGSLEGYVLSPTKRKRCTAIHIFSLADVCGCRGVGFMLFFGFCSLFCSLHITLSQELIFIFSCHLVCDLSTVSRCHAHPEEIRVSGAEALRIFAFLSVAQRAKERKSFAFP